LNVELHEWSRRITGKLSTLLRLEKVLKHGPTIQLLMWGSDKPTEDRLVLTLTLLKKSPQGRLWDVMMAMISLLRDDNVYEIEKMILLVSGTTSKGAEVCFGEHEVSQQRPTQLAEVAVVSQLRTSGLAKPARIVVISVANMLGIRLDSNGNASADSLEKSMEHMKGQYAKILAESHCLENLRLSLKAVDPDGVSRLLNRLDIEATRVVEDVLSGLPPALDGLVEDIRNDELEMQSPLTDLKPLQRLAIGTGEAQSLLTYLTLRDDGEFHKLCIHFSERIRPKHFTSYPLCGFSG